MKVNVLENGVSKTIEMDDDVFDVPKELEIECLKNELKMTDYKAIKFAEGWITEEEYAPIKSERESLRERIRSLENKM